MLLCSPNYPTNTSVMRPVRVTKSRVFHSVFNRFMVLEPSTNIPMASSQTSQTNNSAQSNDLPPKIIMSLYSMSPSITHYHSN